MLNEKDIFEMYAGEIVQTSDISSMINKVLITYKILGEIESYRIDDNPFGFYKYQKDKDYESEIPKNSLVIGGNLKLSPETYDEMSSMFINNTGTFNSDKISVYIDKDEQRAQIITDSDNESLLLSYKSEALWCSIITYLLPWHFKTVREKYPDLIVKIATIFSKKSITSDLQSEFEKAVEISKIEEKILAQKLEMLATNLRNRSVTRVRDQLEDLKREYDDLTKELYDVHQDIRDKAAHLRGLELQLEEFRNPGTEIIEFINKTTEDISIVDIFDSTVILKFRCILDQVDNEGYERLVSLNTGSSYLFGNWLCYYDKELIKEYYKRIFETKEYKLFVGTKISINMGNGEVRALRAEEEICPHPHLNGNLSCFGNASQRIRQYVLESRYEEALNAMIYASHQFSIADSTAGGYLLSGMKDTKCIELPNGDIMSGIEVMEMIKKEAEDKK